MPVILRSGCAGRGLSRGSVPVCGNPCPAPLHGSFQVGLFNGLQEIVDALHFKCLDRIAVVCSGHYHLGLYVRLAEYLKAASVRKFHVHEYYVGPVGGIAEPFQGLGHRACLPDYVHLRVKPFKGIGKASSCHCFVFNYQYIHLVLPVIDFCVAVYVGGGSFPDSPYILVFCQWDADPVLCVVGISFHIFPVKVSVLFTEVVQPHLGRFTPVKFGPQVVGDCERFTVRGDSDDERLLASHLIVLDGILYEHLYRAWYHKLLAAGVFRDFGDYLEPVRKPFFQKVHIHSHEFHLILQEYRLLIVAEHVTVDSGELVDECAGLFRLPLLYHAVKDVQRVEKEMRIDLLFELGILETGLACLAAFFVHCCPCGQCVIYDVDCRIHYEVHGQGYDEKLREPVHGQLFLSVALRIVHSYEESRPCSHQYQGRCYGGGLCHRAPMSALKSYISYCQYNEA